MLSEGMNWKKGLLESNLPLEYEILDTLTHKGFTVNSDYKFARTDGGIMTDMAVDVYASAFTPYNESEKVTSKIEIVVECEHRHPDTRWLFIPDMNVKPEFRPQRSRSIRVIDQFSSYAIREDAMLDFDMSIPVCQKGIGINVRTGEIVSSELGKKIEKLQHALPRIYTENVLIFLNVQPEFNLPFLFCPILVTSTRLFMLRKNMTDRQVEHAADLEDIADEVPFILMYSDYGPGFESQCKNECNRLKLLHKNEKALVIEQKRARYFNSRENLPFTIVESLTTADRYHLKNLFTQFIVCTSAHFPNLIDKIKSTTIAATASGTIIER